MYRSVLGPFTYTIDVDIRRRRNENAATELPPTSPWVTGNFYPPSYYEEATAAVGSEPLAQVEEQDFEVTENSRDKISLKCSQTFVIASASGGEYISDLDDMDNSEASAFTPSQSSMNGSLCLNCRHRRKREATIDTELKSCFEMKVPLPDQNNVVRLCDVISAWTESPTRNEKPILFCRLFGCNNSFVNKLGRFQAQATSMNGSISMIFYYSSKYETGAVINHTVSLPEYFDFAPWARYAASGQAGNRQHWARLKTLIREVHTDNDNGAKRTLTFMRKKVSGGAEDAWECLDKDEGREGGPLTYPLAPWVKPNMEMTGKYRNVYAVYEPVIPFGCRDLWEMPMA
ncbi:hypothetical protein V8F20_004639 [Naviculisporaceae sp. PSN 640]